MKEIIIKKTVFEFGELSERAKEKAKGDYICDEIIQQDTIDFMLDEFDNEVKKFEDRFTELEIQYDFSCCQGSGLNIYGSIGAGDVYTLAKNAKIFTSEELNRFAFYSNYLPELRLSENRDYSYSFKDIDRKNLNIENDLIFDSEYAPSISNNKIDVSIEDLMLSDIDLINRIYQYIFNYFVDWESKIYEDTLNNLTTVPDDATMADLSNCNNWYYYADGSLATDIL